MRKYLDFGSVGHDTRALLRFGGDRQPRAASRRETGRPGVHGTGGVRRHDDVLRSRAGPDGAPVTFLLDEILDIRTFENFPGFGMCCAI
jgi:hypothetical protein